MTNVENKLDEVLLCVKNVDAKLDSVEKKLDTRLTNVENKCSKLENNFMIQKSRYNLMSSEITELKSNINELQQQQLKNNIVVRGVTEMEKSSDELLFMIDDICSRLYSLFGDNEIDDVRRIGPKTEKVPRNVLVKFKNVATKSNIIKNSRKNLLDCSQFDLNGAKYGNCEQKIYISDHLTTASNEIFYEARKLKKKGVVKYVWTKFGKVYIKKDDLSRAHYIKSIANLNYIIKNLTSIPSDESDSEPEIIQVDSVKENHHRKLSSKRVISPPTPKKTPRPKRNKAHYN